MTISFTGDTNGKGVYQFRLFGQLYELDWKSMASALGFNPAATKKIESLSGFDANDFWSKIGTDTGRRQEHTSDIHSPTLRVLHRWISQYLTPRDDGRAVTNLDKAYLFAAVKKKKTNPTYLLINH